jgi:hypothetical protein
MKKVFSVITAFVLVFAMFALTEADVNAENTCTTGRTVVLHYHRWDDDYSNMDFWTWGTGTNGSGNPQIVEYDDFGAVAYFCIDDDADAEAGLIPRVNDWSYKDGIDADENADVDNKFIPLKDEEGNFVGFDENGIKHVYVLQGSNEVYTAEEGMPFFQQDGFGTLVVVYYDTAESYAGWNIWNWGTGTGGTMAGDAFGGSGVPFQYELGIDQGTEPGKFRVAVFNIAEDADDTMGFIVRTDAWEKKFAEDLFLDISGIKGSGTQFSFYIAGEGDFYDNFSDFEATVNFFEISSSQALDPNSVEVVFNKDVITSVDDEIVFDPDTFTLTDKDGAAVAIDSVSFNSTTDVNTTFTLILGDDLTGEMGPYTVSYAPDAENTYTSEFEVDSEAPTITIIGARNVELELGDTYSLPTYTATDTVGEESVQLYTIRVKEGHGTVDTRNAGIYEVVITANDKFGNVNEETITVTVVDPCDETAHLNADANIGVELAALLVGLPLAIGAAFVVRRNH